MPRTHRRGVAAALATAVLTVVLARSASAQYFGQNKVWYKEFDFKVLKTEHFDIYFYPGARAGIDVSARLAERWYLRLSRVFEHELRGRQPLILYAAPADFQPANVIGGDLGGVGGVTESLRRRIVMPLRGPLADTDHVPRHELVHAFQFDMTMLANDPTHQGGMNKLRGTR